MITEEPAVIGGVPVPVDEKLYVIEIIESEPTNPLELKAGVYGLPTAIAVLAAVTVAFFLVMFAVTVGCVKTYLAESAPVNV